MATKSVLKTVQIRNRKSVLNLVRALENAHEKKAQQVNCNRTFTDASREDIRKMFGNNDDRV